MVNELKMAQRDSILGLLALGWSQRRIARELEVNRETVARYARLTQPQPNPANSTSGSKGSASPNPANPTSGSEGSASPNPANTTSGTSSPRQTLGRQSSCQLYDEIIRKKIDQGLSAQRVYQDLVADQGFTGSYCSVKRYTRRLREKVPLPFRRMEVEPGTEAQVCCGSPQRSHFRIGLMEPPQDRVNGATPGSG